MLYEEENKKLQERLKEIEPAVQKMKIYFENHPNKKNGSSSLFYKSPQRYLMEEVAQSKYYIYDYDNFSDEYLQYRILDAEVSSIKHRLSESGVSRALDDGITFLGSITPQHVSGRIYRVENGDGCGTFCLWFIIIDAIIIFIWYLASQ